MRTLLLLLLLGLAVPADQTLTMQPARTEAGGPGQTPASSQEAPVAVVSYKWSKTKLTPQQAGTTTTIPAAAMIPANKNFERNRRANASPGERDPNLDTIDGRSAALERSVQESRGPKPVEGFVYRSKFRNTGAKIIEVLFWEYQFQEAANPSVLTRRQFLCGVSVKPGKEKELQGFSMSGPSDVISVSSLNKDLTSAFQEKVVINRVEYSDGSIWQRPGWNFASIRLTYNRALATPWFPDMCKGL